MPGMVANRGEIEALTDFSHGHTTSDILLICEYEHFGFFQFLRIKTKKLVVYLCREQFIKLLFSHPNTISIGTVYDKDNKLRKTYIEEKDLRQIQESKWTKMDGENSVHLYPTL